MGCSNARLLVQTPLSETNTPAAATLNTNNPLNLLSPIVATSNETSPMGVATDINNTTTSRMHLTGVDLVVERNGSYTLLLTPKTHKQLMPFVLRKKRFRILVDKPRSEATPVINSPLKSYDSSITQRIMESGKELKLSGKKGKKQTKHQMESTIESVQQAASDELDKAKARFVGGRSIDRGNPEDEDENIQSDDEGMIEETVTTVEEDKDLECKVKKKIETKKTVAEDPETHNRITKIVKTEVTEITRTITINDQHDLERAKRELGIDDVNKLLPSTQVIYNLPSTYHSTSSWIDHPRLTQVQEKHYEPSNEIVTLGDFPSDSPIKQHSPPVLENENTQEQSLAEATIVGRGLVVETISPSSLSTQPNEQKLVEKKQKKTKSSLNLCSCTRSPTTDYDEEQRKQKAANRIEQISKQKKKASVTTTNALITSPPPPVEAQIQGQQLISSDIKQLIIDKKSLLIDYIHSKIFLPGKLFTTNEQDSKGRKISSRILDLLRFDRCSSWQQMSEQIKDEYSDQLPANIFIQPMTKTYEELFTTKQSNLVNTFSTIHQEKDIKNIPNNKDYITIVQTYINERDNQPNIGIITKPVVENMEDSLQRLQHHVQSDNKVIDDDHGKQQSLEHTKDLDMSDDINKSPVPIYNEDQLTKMLADISQHKPITLAEAIAYQYIDLEDPKLGLSNDTTQRIKNLFRPLSFDDETTLNLIRIKRSGEYLTDLNLVETNPFEKFHLSEPFIYQLQQSFEPTLDFNEKQFRSLTETILNNKDEYSNLQFDIGRTLIPAGDMKESSTNDFSQSDSGYSMTTATHESLASKIKSEFETINEPSITDQTIDQTKHETVEKTKIEPPPTPVYIKKRKSNNLLSCFGSKKPKASTEQHGQSTVTPPVVTLDKQPQTTPTLIEDKSSIDHAVLPDGKRVYIDVFLNRPGLDMSYKPNDFETRFILPVAKSTSEENIEEHKPMVHLEPRSPIIEPVDVQAEVIIEKPIVHLEPRSPIIEPVDVQSEVEKVIVHLEPRSPIIEPVDVQADITEHKLESIHVKSDQTPIVIPLKKSEESTVSKALTNLHGAPVDLPAIELVKPGPLPTLSKHKKAKESILAEKTPKIRNSTGGLCASCFGSKAAEKKKKESISPTVKAPIEQKKVVEEEKKDEIPPTTIITAPIIELSVPSTINDINRTIQDLEKPDDRLDATIEKLVPTSEPHYQLPSSEPVPLTIIENEYSLPDTNTYDIPRVTKTPSIENIQINTEEKLLNHETILPVEELPPMPKVEINETSTKGSYTLPATTTSKTKKVKTEKKPGLFSSFFRQSDKKSKTPALNLPSVDRDLSPNNQLREPHRHDSDPLRVPNTDLPKPDISLPTYDRPEVDLSSGQVEQSPEFSIPSVDLPPIPNLHLPENDNQPIDSNTDLMKIPNVELPEVEFTSKQEIPNVEFTFKQEKEVEHLPTIETGLALASPINDMFDIQLDQKDFPIETDYEIKTEPIIPDLPLEEREILTKPEFLSTEQKYTITDTYFVQPPELSLSLDKQTTESPPKLPDFTFELPSLEPISILSKDTASSPPSFDDDVPATSSKIVSAIEISPSTPPIKSTEKQLIQPKSDIKKKSSTMALCSCFGNKSKAQKDKAKTLAIPKKDLPEVKMSSPSTNLSTTLKTKSSLRAPGNDLPPVDLTLPTSEPVRLPAIHSHEKKRQAPKKPIVTEEKILPQTITTSPEAVVPQVDIQQTNDVPSTEQEPLLVQSPIIENEVNERSPAPTPVIEKQSVEEIHVRLPTPPPEEIKVESTSSTAPIEKQSVEEIQEPKKHSSFEIKAPAVNIPELDLSGPPKSDAYTTSFKHEESLEPIQSRSDSGLEAILTSHIHPSSTFGTNQTTTDDHPSISSGLGSEIIDSMTTKGYTLPEIHREQSKRENSLLKHDFARKITMNDESRAKLIFRQTELKKCLESEISESIEEFDPKKDQKTLNKILTHAIDLIKDKKVTTYPELKQKLIIEHKNEAFIVDPVVRSLYCTIEKQGLDNLDKPEFPLAIRDMVRLPAKQTFDTVAHLNKEETPAPQITKHKSSTSSCLTCGRSKSKPKVPTTTTTTNTGLLDDRRRSQLNTHRQGLGNILRDHIQSTQPPIRKFPEHTREVEKIIRKSLTLVTQPKILSYEQIRNDLKSENKQTFYLIDPIIDIIRDTFDHCDITQMNEKTNLDILDSNISQTANLYNNINNQSNLLTTEEHNLLKSNQLNWLNQYLIDNELKNKKITNKQNKELNKILSRALNILSLNHVYTWDELSSQLKREYPKAHDQCDRSIELIKQGQKDGLLLLHQSPNVTQQDVTSINIINANGKRRTSSLITDRAKQNLKSNRNKILSSITSLLYEYNKPLYNENQIENYVNKTFHALEEQKSGQFNDYNDLKEKLKKDFKRNHEKLIEQIVDVIEQAHASNQFDDIDKPEVQTLLRDRLNGKPLVIKEMYVSLPPRAGAYGTSKQSNDESSRYLSTAINGDRTLNSSPSSHRVGRGLSWREANERARILFYRGKHPAIHYDEQADGFDVRMLLETTSGGTQEIPVTDSDVHELLNSCGVQWDGVNIISLVDHSEDVVRAAEQAALKVIREKGLVDLRTPPPPSSRNPDDIDEPLSS